ncbi:MAG: hypothetical protein K5922_03140 [Clostridiales bacterium]|nr:hypothetical protein [Clostridiales bacterium]
MNLTGGLADVTCAETAENRCSLKVGNVRVLDLVGTGPDVVVECKGSKRDPVRAKPEAVLQTMADMVNRLHQQAGVYDPQRTEAG